jgi:hypothetical protein
MGLFIEVPRRWSIYKTEFRKSPRPYTFSEFRKRSVLHQICVHNGFPRANQNRGPIKNTYNPLADDTIVLDIPSEVGIHLVF